MQPCLCFVIFVQICVLDLIFEVLGIDEVNDISAGLEEGYTLVRVFYRREPTVRLSLINGYFWISVKLTKLVS